MKNILLSFTIALSIAACTASHTSTSKKSVILTDSKTCRVIVNQI